MRDIKPVALSLKKYLTEVGIDKYSFQISEIETHEFNADSDNFNLYRTLFDNSVYLTVYYGSKEGSSYINSFEEADLKTLIETALISAKSGSDDPCFDIAPKQNKELFNKGCFEPDMENMFFRCREFYKNVSEEYPCIKTISLISDHVKKHILYCNSNETEFETFGGQYNFSYTFAASKEDKTTGIQIVEKSFTDLSIPFIEMDQVRINIENAIASLFAQSISGKFEGPVIITPDCLEFFMNSIINNFVYGASIFSGTSPWIESIGKMVANEKLSVSYNSSDKRIINSECFTEDGYKTEDLCLIEKGILKSFVLPIYFANKLNMKVSKNTSHDLVVARGDTSLEDIIKSIDRGLILGRFSGGEPNANGEFSGVAKNSFLIEKGKVSAAVTETMVNGNYLDILKNIRSISKEVVCNGKSVLPYIAVDGVVISGK